MVTGGRKGDGGRGVRIAREVLTWWLARTPGRDFWPAAFGRVWTASVHRATRRRRNGACGNVVEAGGRPLRESDRKPSLRLPTRPLVETL